MGRETRPLRVIHQFNMKVYRPYTTVVLAMTADGKIADRQRQAARFGSKADRLHLEQRIAAVDAVLMGAGTVRAYGTSLGVTNPTLLAQREDRGQSPQPIQILCSASGILDPQWRFFQQNFSRWLITLQDPLEHWWNPARSSAFEEVLWGQSLAYDPAQDPAQETIAFDWIRLGDLLWQQGIHSLAVLGGGTLVASLLAQGGIDELHLTLCPFILGGKDAPTPVEGLGWLQAAAVPLQLMELKPIGHEVFLRYKVSE